MTSTDDTGAPYTWDVFSTLAGFGSYGPEGDWGGYWNAQGPELLEHRARLFETPQRLVFRGHDVPRERREPVSKRRPEPPRRLE